MAEDPEVREAVEQAGFPQPQFKGYEVLSIRSVGEVGKELARRITDEVWTQGKLDLIDELFAADCISTDPTNGEIRGTKALRSLIEGYRAAFPDMKMTADLVLAEGDWSVVHWTATGTHTGELMGMAPTAREATVSGVQFNRIAGGKIVEARGVFDALGMLQQIGAVPVGEPAHA
jgi:steroid delta-isomerase-like uncharacterized protein